MKQFDEIVNNIIFSGKRLPEILNKIDSFYETQGSLDKNRSPIQSRILWFTNSFLFLSPSLFKISLSLTTTAFSRLPPLANPALLSFSTSSYKQNFLDSYIYFKSSLKILILFL